MKLRHTSGAVIEVDDNSVQEFPLGYLVGRMFEVRNTYSKVDWTRVPEERWEASEMVHRMAGESTRESVSGCGNADDEAEAEANDTLRLAAGALARLASEGGEAPVDLSPQILDDTPNG